VRAHPRPERRRHGHRDLQYTLCGEGGQVLDEVLHPDYVRHPSMEGVEATKRRLAEMASKYPDAQTVTEDTIAEGDKVVTHWTAHAGGKATATGVSMHRIVDSKIIEDWAWSRNLLET
jgi:predicted SnoaL-like aldol condensation-catalyzing enzyme